MSEHTTNPNELLHRILKGADEESKPIYDAIVKAFSGNGLNAIEVALQKVLADWALGVSRVCPTGTPKDHMESLMAAALIRIEVFLEKHPEERQR